jgi:DNA-binding transcriptional MerR regulator
MTQALYWVETKGLTLEEIDAIFDHQKHSDVPNIEQMIDVDVGVLERQLARETHEDDRELK